MYHSLYLTEWLVREKTDGDFGLECRGKLKVRENKSRYVPTRVSTLYNIYSIIMYIRYKIYIVLYTRV